MSLNLVIIVARFGELLSLFGEFLSLLFGIFCPSFLGFLSLFFWNVCPSSLGFVVPLVWILFVVFRGSYNNMETAVNISKLLAWLCAQTLDPDRSQRGIKIFRTFNTLWKMQEEQKADTLEGHSCTTLLEDTPADHFAKHSENSLLGGDCSIFLEDPLERLA